MKRYTKVLELLKKNRLDAVLISSPAHIIYLTGFDHFTPFEREAFLFITKNKQYIITDGRYSEAIKRGVPYFKLFERSHKTPTEDLFKSLKKDIKSLGIEEDNLTVSEYKFIKRHFKKLKNFEVGQLRTIKTDKEIKKIEKASHIGDIAFDRILKEIKVGVTEREFQ